jgi:hypothetical protein
MFFRHSTAIILLVQKFISPRRAKPFVSFTPGTAQFRRATTAGGFSAKPASLPSAAENFVQIAFPTQEDKRIKPDW